MLAFLLLTITLLPVNNNKEIVVVNIYEAETDCTLTDGVLDCVSVDKATGQTFYTVCTIDNKGTQCIDYIIDR